MGLAEENFKKAIEINPEYSVAHFNLGIIHGRNNRFNLALQSLERAIEIDLGYLMAHRAIAAIENNAFMDFCRRELSIGRRIS